MIIERVEGKSGKINYEQVIADIVSHIMTFCIGYKRATIQIFLMSAFDITEHLNDLREIGMKEFLRKPFHMQKLVAMVEKYIGQRTIVNSPQIGSG